MLVAAPAAWSAGWIITVARWGAGIPTAAVAWGTGPLALALLTSLCVAMVVVAPRVLRRPSTSLACTGLLVVAMLVRPPSIGWPAEGWVLAMCDVGQGDGLVLRAAEHAAVVVDAGPDPVAMDACLDRLDVTSVPLLVLTHFHADHVDGVAGVGEGRTLGDVEGTVPARPGGGGARGGDGARPRPGAAGVRHHQDGR